MTAQRIGIVGLSEPGAAIARRYAASGFLVTAYDCDPEKVAVLQSAGVHPARLPADAAEGAALVFLCSADDVSAEEALFDLGGVGETLPDGGYVLDVSRVTPPFAAQASRRLAALGLTRVAVDLVGLTAQADVGALRVQLHCGVQHAAALTPRLRVLAHSIDLAGPQRDVAIAV